MPETATERLAALIGLVAAMVLFYIAFSADARQEAVPGAAAAGGEAVAATATPPASAPPAARATPTPKPAAKTPLLVLTAARGDCWLSARRETGEGPLLYEGVLVRGRSLRLDGARLWLRVGAAANVDVTLNGKKIAALPTGTSDVIVTAKGVRPAV